MIGDHIEIEERHLQPALKIVSLIHDKITTSEKFTISVGGESGSGKSTLALAIRKVLEAEKTGCYVFHMDDYFRLPPVSNHDKRVENISWVGPGEVHLDLLQSHLDEFKQGAGNIEKPLVHYRANNILSEGVNLSAFHVAIVEGTYTTMLERVDCKIFMLRNYRHTLVARRKRARDPIIPFNEEVLEIEHQIISKHRELADILVGNDYQVEDKR